ncbi:hypothetical protein XELAEV_18041063mg [Xenopus laevis]|uniref:Uncharacterized protein n=1 Tax=Xenopus laevis TaxID=8355 RepID=A0A974C1K2_XENLA|nr:hypothetical protein XELAEV_18041063mg [Xenopus laevis]
MNPELIPSLHISLSSCLMLSFDPFCRNKGRFMYKVKGRLCLLMQLNKFLFFEEGGPYYTWLLFRVSGRRLLSTVIKERKKKAGTLSIISCSS